MLPCDDKDKCPHCSLMARRDTLVQQTRDQPAPEPLFDIFCLLSVAAGISLAVLCILAIWFLTL